MNGRRALYFILSVVLFVLIVVFAVYVVFMRFRPETEVQRMLRAMSKVETVRERSAFSWTRGEGKARVATSLYLVGQIDSSGLPSIQQDTKFRLFRLKTSKQYTDLSGELRTTGGTTYLTYSPPGPSVPGVDFSSKETWVSFADGELPKWGSMLPGLDAPIVSLPATSSYLEPVAPWTNDAILRLRDLLAVADVFLVRYDDVTEIVDAHATRVIEARFDPDAIRAFLADEIRAKLNREPNDAERVIVESRAKQLESLKVRLWIGTTDHLLYRFQASGTVAEEPKTKATVDVLVNLSDFNAPYGGEVPSPRKTVGFLSIANEMIGTLESSADMAGLPSPALVSNDAAHLPVETTESKDDVDNDGLSAIVEAFYGTNPNKADTDGDGKNDGEEVLNGQNPSGTGSLFGFGLGQ
ncbi:MAG: hypothetical protein WCO25_06115 [Candidatus Uhrbacteria bacterium]